MNEVCSIQVLESALAGQLSPEAEASLHRHLEECESCGAAIERLAGGLAFGKEAATLLMEDELDEALPAHGVWSEIDFTVENLEPPTEPNTLGRLGGYDVLEIIGRGGMGVVLKGYDRELKRCVAIKALAPHLAQNPLAKKRFAREAQAAAAVVHPHVLAIHQVQPAGRLPFLVMPLVAGESLAERIAKQGTLELKEILRIGMQAAAGLAAAHEQGLVHRDVKPANILLEKGIERAVLTDFGLARAADDAALTRWGVIACTPQYMSPEQARGEPLDGRSDLFSLGCVLYEMATGVSPFLADSAMATMCRLVDDPPQAMASLNAELPPWFISIVMRLLEKDPGKRFASAGEVSELLESCLAHLQQPTSAPLPAAVMQSLARPAARRILSRKALRWMGTLVALLLFGWGAAEGLLMATAEPGNIAGKWQGEDWGEVVLEQASDGTFTGTYTDTYDKTTPGEIVDIKWSRLERRYVGRWREGEKRFGPICLHREGDAIRGAWGADAKCEISPDRPHMRDLSWIGVRTAEFEEVVQLEFTVNDPDPVDRFLDLDSGRVLSFNKELVKVLNSLSIENKINDGDLRFTLIRDWMHETGADVVAASSSPKPLAPGNDVPIFQKLHWRGIAYEHASLIQIGGLSAALPGRDSESSDATFHSVTADQVSKALQAAKQNLGKSDSLNLWGYAPNVVYAFKTREGGVGVLEVLSASYEKVKIRYKLLRHRGEIAELSSGHLSVRDLSSASPRLLQFGPVVQLELTLNDIFTGGFADLDKEKLIGLPKELFHRFRDVQDFDLQTTIVRDWMLENGADVVAKEKNSRPPLEKFHWRGAACGQATLIQIDGLSMALPSKDTEATDAIFNNVTAEQITKALQAAEKKLGEDDSFNIWGYAPNIVYAFKTREGGSGVLEIVSATSEKVKIRYKLLSLIGEDVESKDRLKKVDPNDDLIDKIAKARLDFAEVRLARLEKAEKTLVGSVSESQLQAARDEVRLRKAELSGDPSAKSRLEIAESNLSRLENVKTDSVLEWQLQAAKDEVRLRKAEIGGDPVELAKVRLEIARAKLVNIEQLAKAGYAPAFDREVAQSDLRLAEAELNAAVRKEEAAKPTEDSKALAPKVEGALKSESAAPSRSKDGATRWRQVFGPAVNGLFPFESVESPSVLLLPSGAKVSLDPKDRKQLADAMAAHKDSIAVALIAEDKTIQITRDDVVRVMSSGRDLWNTLSAYDVDQQLFNEERITEGAGRASGVDKLLQSELPITYLFKTAAGECGELELFSVVSWRGIDYRFKLLKNVKAPAPKTGPTLAVSQDGVEVNAEWDQKTWRIGDAVPTVKVIVDVNNPKAYADSGLAQKVIQDQPFALVIDGRRYESQAISSTSYGARFQIPSQHEVHLDEAWACGPFKTTEGHPTHGTPLELTPGKHTVQVLFTAWDQTPTPASDPFKIEILPDGGAPPFDEMTMWGNAVSGVQLSAKATRSLLPQGATPTLLVRIRNGGLEKFTFHKRPSAFALEVDEIRYCYPTIDPAWRMPFGPGDEYEVPISLGKVWEEGNPTLSPKKSLAPLAPGKHVVRVIWLEQSENPPPTSPRVEIEITNEKFEPAKDFGDASESREAE